MPTKFRMTCDVAGYNGFGLVPSLDNYNAVLATGVVQSMTVPSEYPRYLAVFSYSAGNNVWVNTRGTAVVPVGTLAAHGSELNPAGRMLDAGTTISVITGDATGAYMSVALYVVAEFGN